MSTQFDHVVYKRAEIEGNSLGDEIVFFDGRAGKYFATGRVGADIWSMLATPMSVDAIVKGLLDLYEIDEGTCRAQTRSFIVEMLEMKLLENAQI